MNPFTLPDGYLVYRKYAGITTVRNIAGLEPTPEVEFHLLRHFTSVSSYYRSTLIGKSFQVFNPSASLFHITDENIDQELSTVGSKFLPSLPEMSNPRELIVWVINRLHKEVTGAGLPIFDNGDSLTIFLTVKLPHHIGRSAVQRKEPNVSYSMEKRGDEEFLVSVCNKEEMPLTQRLSTVIEVKNGTPNILTIYPGPFAPPLPNKDLIPEERVYSERFWNEHAFVSGIAE